MSAGWNNFSQENGSPGDEFPACASCKKRKLRCSRETPTCSHCQRLATECVYQPKQKPGLKPGAVEALTRRVACLERILLDDSGNVRPQFNDTTEVQDVSLIKNGDLHSHSADNSPNLPQPDEPAKAHSEQGQQEPKPNPLKRKLDHAHVESWRLDLDDIDISQHLPGQPLLSKVVDFFCTSFHHWIPYIHKQRLQKRVCEGVHSPGFDLVLHALVAVGFRHMDPNILFLDQAEIRRQSRISHLIVETHSVRNVSLESLQALIFIVFDYLNNGQTHRAWPLIGSLTRTIDYLQLTTEPSPPQLGSLMKPVRLVQPTNDWTELEERRRLFWVIFLLDRFCSIGTGWNTSLTADDVHRRLPADGGYFTREEPVTTPYFGIWNKAAARIGKSLANVPAQYNEEDSSVEPPGASPGSANSLIDASKLGAFAYCVEATESLSQVTAFFLQQRINWQDKEHAVNWLTRFKELDLRLVHWKIFLPPKWKDSNISADRTIIDMDPNLTLAHMTHNTSMILLHHPVAFPPMGWRNFVALPRECSAQTCELAAVETSNIVDKFLAHTPIPFVNAQFSFCAFVAAKVLLYDHQASRRPLRPEFQRLTRDIYEMSSRWRGKYYNDEFPNSPVNQAGRYARHLDRLYEACQQDLQFRFDLYDHTCGEPGTQHYTSPISASTPHYLPQATIHKRPSIAGYTRHNSMNNSQSLMSPKYHAPGAPPSGLVQYKSLLPGEGQTQLPGPLPSPGLLLSPRGSFSSSYTATNSANAYNSTKQTFYQIGASPVRPTAAIPQIHTSQGVANQSAQDESLLLLSDTFMDSQFLDMDRVITFEDANFFMPYGDI
ncbi:hypothetical protein GQ44DRAFT_772455 [Phaeosphaeriaceae sp. PMI808]|nr:hypothetical protein GQ44DRAFT_772455 [Phaeosphaeriaceae sp. PMI808]